MSWQSYVDSLIATNKMTHAGIFGLDGSPWAVSPGFPVATEQVKTIIQAISDSSKAANGVNVGADRYILVRSDTGISIVLKKGASGIIGYKSSQCAIVAVHNESTKSEITLTSVGKVIDYLGKHGY